MLTTKDGGDILKAVEEEMLIGEFYGRLEVDSQETGKPFDAAFSKVPPKEAIQYFRNKRLAGPTEFKEMNAAAKQQAFAVAGLNQRYVLEGVHQIITSGIESGVPHKQIISELKTNLEALGVVPLANHHLETVVRTNMQSAYAAGRYKQMAKVSRRRPFWEYQAVGDDRTRPSHQAMDGKIFRADDPIWNEWFPPNGYNCRCRVVSLSADEMKERGVTLAPPPNGSNKPDVGFEGSPSLLPESQKAIAKLSGEAAKLRILKPPVLGSRTELGKVHLEAGDIGIGDVVRKAKVIDSFAELSEAEIKARLKIGAFSITDQYRRLTPAFKEIRIPFPSQFQDSLELLLKNIGADKLTKDALLDFKVFGQATYDPRLASLTRPEAVVLSNLTRLSEIVLSFRVRGDENARALLRHALSIQSGGDGAIRRAVDVAHIVARGGIRNADGYVSANLARLPHGKKHEARVTLSPLSGFNNEQILITKELEEELRGKNSP